MGETFVHGYIPNTAPGVKERMLKAAGYSSVDQIYEEIPEPLRFNGQLNVPKKPKSEMEVARHVQRILAKNRTTGELLSFLGAGCWPHYIPALCDEIIGRSEFLTAYAGSEATDHGRYQALFEFQSMMGDLLDMDVVGVPVFDGFSASADAVLMAARITGRRKLLIPEVINLEKLTTMRTYCAAWLDIIPVKTLPGTGWMDLDDLLAKIDGETAAVYHENPNYFGIIDPQGEDIAEIAHRHGALAVACVYPTSLGILKPPGEFGADIACAEGQPIGTHLNAGGACMGILGCHDDPRLVAAMPSFLIGLTKTEVEGEYAFSWHAVWEHRIMYTIREKAKSFTGSSAALWAFSAAVYLSLLGPRGMERLGETNMQKARYAMARLIDIPGLKVPFFNTPHFNEFTVNFDETGKTVAQINEGLLERGILGGKDISREFPALGNTALYCVTEVHTKNDIDHLGQALEEVVRNG